MLYEAGTQLLINRGDSYEISNTGEGRGAP
jgi:hypothetical protein